MKKIGILFGRERSFPEAFVRRVNEIAPEGIQAEAVRIDKIFQAEPLDYAVIIDRISQDVPFYRAALKNAAITGTAVINNPFWWSADEKFFNNALAVKLGVPVPKTALIPSYEQPDDTSDESFSNLVFPMAWEETFAYTGFPAYMKPFDGGGWKEVYKLHDREDFFDKHSKTGQTVMMLQEEILFEEYFRCYCIGGKYVRVMPYEPRNPFHLRYQVGTPPADPALLATIEEYVLKLNRYLGYDFNTVEFAVRDGVPYAIDFCNPAPDAELTSVGEENFEWVVETSARYAIERAQVQLPGQDNLTWGEYLRTASAGASLLPAEKAEDSKPGTGKAVEAKGKQAKTAPVKQPARKGVAKAAPVKAVTVQDKQDIPKEKQSTGAKEKVAVISKAAAARSKKKSPESK